MKVVKQRFCRAVTALIAASMITGCASDKTDTKLNVALHPDKPMRVFVGNCTINEPFLEGQDQAAIAAIGGILLSSLIKVGVDRIGTALENSAKARTATLISSLNFDATAKERPACIQIIRGKFKNDKHIGSGSDQPSTLGQWHVDRLPENVADASKFKENLAKNGAILASDPEFFFEGRFVFSEDFSGYALQPVLLALDRPAIRVRTGEKRGISVLVTIQKPGQEPGKASATFDLPLGMVEPKSARYFELPKKPVEVEWSPVNDPVLLLQTNQNESITLKTYPPYATPWTSFPYTDKRSPWTISVAVAESLDADAFLQFVADVFKESKEDVTKELQALTPAARMKASEEADEAYYKAQTDAVAAVKALCDSYKPEKPEEIELGKFIAAERAQRLALTAANEADQLPVFEKAPDQDLTKYILSYDIEDNRFRVPNADSVKRLCTSQ